MTKYENLATYLSQLAVSQWTASFSEIEGILGFGLPKSAYSYPAWWSNQVGEGHSHSAAWKSVGWRTGELDLGSQKVSFFPERDNHTKPPSAAALAIEGKQKGLTIGEAKAGLAVYFGVPTDNIEVIIKG